MQQRKVNIYLYVSRMKGVGIAEAKDTSTQPMSEFTFFLNLILIILIKERRVMYINIFFI